MFPPYFFPSLANWRGGYILSDRAGFIFSCYYTKMNFDTGKNFANLYT